MHYIVTVLTGCIIISCHIFPANVPNSSGFDLAPQSGQPCCCTLPFFICGFPKVPELPLLSKTGWYVLCEFVWVEVAWSLCREKVGHCTAHLELL